MSAQAGLTYRSTQSAYYIPILLVIAALTAGFLAASTDSVAPVVIWIVLAVLAVIRLVFSRLTVMVGKGQVLAEFGPGWPRRRYRLSDVTRIETVRNKWWYGWGLRWIPGGSMYNVWGLDAVELELTSGKVFRIGSDEPEALRAALESEQAQLDDRSRSGDTADG